LSVKEPSARQTEATAVERGRYPVNLAVSNGFLSVNVQVLVGVYDRPVVKAGEGGIVRSNEDVELAVHIMDNGLGQNDPDPLKLHWEMESGPAAPKFSDPAALAGTVRFPVKGIYVLRLTADNGFFISSDMVRYAVNQKPLIKGATDGEISWNMPIAVIGQVLDDGRGDPALGELTALWSIVTGPAGAQIENPGSLATELCFNQKGIYILRLEVSNGFSSSQADARIVVNQPPRIYAGANQVVRPETKVNLSGQVVDDGLGDPAHSKLGFRWTQLSGPMDTRFSNADSKDTQVTLTRLGTYIFELKASYERLVVTGQVQVEVVQK
jgi:hypothetical protein